MNRFLLSLLVIGFAMIGSPLLTKPAACAQQQRVAAVVNDGVITERDLEQRVRLAMLSSRAPDDPEVRMAIIHQVLRRLIDETLQIQEGKRLGVSVNDADIAGGIASIEQQNNMPPGVFEQFLKSRNIDVETVKQQIRAELYWVRAVRKQIMPTLLIGDEEIDMRLNALRENRGKPEYLAAEIFLAVDDPRNEADVAQTARRLIDEMRRGAQFSAVARQFSDSGGASGGDLGWVSEGAVDPDVFRVLTSLRPGELSEPLRLSDGYRLLLLRDKRLVGEGMGGETTLDMGLVYQRHIAGISTEERLKMLNGLRSAQSCDALEMAAVKLPTTEWSRMGKVKMSQIPPELAPFAQNLKPGEISEPLVGKNVTRMVMMCAREQSVDGLPLREDIERQIEDERAALAARRYLLDLRRSAFIEIRR